MSVAENSVSEPRWQSSGTPSGHHPEPHYRPSSHPEHRHPEHQHPSPRQSGPSPWVAWAVLAVFVLAIGGAIAWRVTDVRQSKPAAPVVTGSVGVYFSAGEEYKRVSRPVHEGQTDVEAAIAGLVAGPTADEIRQGLNTHIPMGTTLESVKVEPGGSSAKEMAVISLSKTFLDATSRDAREAKREYESRLDQVAYTMGQFPKIASSEVQSGGKTLPVPTVAQLEKPTQPEPVVSEPVSAPKKPAVQPASTSGGSGSAAAAKSGSVSIPTVQRQLIALKYLPPEALTGKNDYQTQQAVMAFQAWQGLTRDGSAGPSTVAALATAKAPTPTSVSGSAGRQAQIFRSKGVALFVQDGALVRAVHVSTGKTGYETPAGTFAIYSKELKHWSTQYNCWLPYASFFNEGYAFHQYEEIPPYPGSHGCCRVPAPEAPWVYQFLVMGTPVHVY